MKVLKRVTRNIEQENELNGLTTFLNTQNSFPLNEMFTAVASSSLSMVNPLAVIQKDKNAWESDTNDISPTITVISLKSQIFINGYGFKTGPWITEDSNRDFPKSWFLNASNDAQNWDQLDFKEEDVYFTDFSQERTFQLNQSKPYRFFKFGQIGVNECQTPMFCLSFIDLFGTLYFETSSQTCIKIVSYFQSLISMCFILISTYI